MRDNRLKRFTLNIYEHFFELGRRMVVRIMYRLPIMSSEQTIQYITDNRCSIARFGDGELSLMMNENSKIGFQNGGAELSQKLKNVFFNKGNLLICFPRYMNSVHGCTRTCKKYWRNWGRYDGLHRKSVEYARTAVGANYTFGDALITRPYIDCQNIAKAQRIFGMLKHIWQDRDILIIEGEKTRLGVGNDLFHGAKSIKRILAPATNAFSRYDQILTAVKKYHTGELVLLALGPTATVLAADLSAIGIQALDIGHVDIEYEWFLRRATTKEAIDGKYTNENKTGHDVSECSNQSYLAQIVCRVE